MHAVELPPDAGMTAFCCMLALRQKGRGSGIKCSAAQNNYTGRLWPVTAAG